MQDFSHDLELQQAIAKHLNVELCDISFIAVVPEPSVIVTVNDGEPKAIPLDKAFQLRAKEV